MDNVDVNMLKNTIELYTLENALKYKAAPRTSSVLGKILAEHSELRAHVKETRLLVNEVVEMVSKMSVEDMKTRLAELRVTLGKPIESPPKKSSTERNIKPLPSAEGSRVVMRFAPNPNGPPTIGSARGIILNSEYARLYGGEFILRFDDTDPVNKRPLLEAYDWYIQDCEWLKAKPDKIVYASDRLEIYYNIAKQLIEEGHAYMCSCSSKEFKQYKDAAKPCPHRNAPIEDNLETWERAVAGELPAGSNILRIKTDITHKDPAIRDFGAFRIVNVDHPRTGRKYTLWPLLDFESAVEDHLLGITHILRGKDLADSEKRQEYIYRYMGWEYPVVVHWGRVKIHEFGKLSTSALARSIAQGEYEGWDDPRVPTIRALRRRGFHPEAIRSFYLGLGVGETDVSISLENLYAENRKYIDSIAKRLFLVRNPVLIKITDAPDMLATPLLHPGKNDEKRHISVASRDGNIKVYVEEDEYSEFEDEEYIRLKDLCTVRVDKKKDVLHYVPGDKISESGKRLRIVHWAPENGPSCFLRTPEGDFLGISEPDALKYEGEIVQFERVGFARIDRIDRRKKEVVAYFAHK